MGKRHDQSVRGVAPYGWTQIDEQLVPLSAGPTWTGLDGEDDYMYKIEAHTKVKGTVHAFQLAMQLNAQSASANYSYTWIAHAAAGANVNDTASQSLIMMSSSQGVGEGCFYEILIQGRAHANGLLISSMSQTDGSGGGDVHYVVGSLADTNPVSKIKFLSGPYSTGGYLQDDLFKLYAARPPKWA